MQRDNNHNLWKFTCVKEWINVAHQLHMAIELQYTTQTEYSVNEWNHMAALGEDWTVLLEWNSQILCRRFWTACMWFRIRKSHRILRTKEWTCSIVVRVCFISFTTTILLQIWQNLLLIQCLQYGGPPYEHAQRWTCSVQVLFWTLETVKMDQVMVLAF